MADVLMWTLLILGIYVIMISYWLLAVALAPNLVDACRQRYESTPLRNLFAGLAVGIPLIAIGLILFSTPNAVFKIGGFAVALLPVLMGLLGSAGLCMKIGFGLHSPRDAEQPWLRVKRGGIVLGLAFIFPLLGWVIVMPLVLVSGIGAMFLSWKEGRRRSQPPTTLAVP